MQIVTEIKEFCAARGITPAMLMAQAGVAIRTWHTWQNGADPKLSTVNKVRAAMSQIGGA